MAAASPISRMNDEDNAFADFNIAIKLDGKIAESWANQAAIYERRGDKARAAKSYPAQRQLDPRLPAGHRGACPHTGQLRCLRRCEARDWIVVPERSFVLR